jgi:hypothetical protein
LGGQSLAQRTPDGGYIGQFEMWIILENFLAGGTRCEEVEAVFDADAQPADTWASTALIGAYRDARQLAHGAAPIIGRPNIRASPS